MILDSYLWLMIIWQAPQLEWHYFHCHWPHWLWTVSCSVRRWWWACCHSACNLHLPCASQWSALSGWTMTPGYCEQLRMCSHFLVSVEISIYYITTQHCYYLFTDWHYQSSTNDTIAYSGKLLSYHSNCQFLHTSHIPISKVMTPAHFTVAH